MRVLPSSDRSLFTSTALTILRAKKIAESSTPANTPSDRSWVITVVPTVTISTVASVRGSLCRVVSEPQSKVAMETMIITATSAAIGMIETRSPRNTMKISRKIPADSVDNRPSPPDLMLITDWPIIAQPAMPPKKPVTTLAMPWPWASRFLPEGVSVRSSRMEAVSSDSSRPTIASAKAVGKMICRVSQFSGISGNRNTGRPSGSSPMSPTSRVGRPMK